MIRWDPATDYEAGEPFIATGTAALIAGLAGAGAGIAGNIMSARANSQAMRQQAEANTQQLALSREAMAQQDAATRRAEEFQREESNRAYTIAELNRRGNYDQWASNEAYDADRWAARQATISNLGERLGLPARAIPARRVPGYVPMPGTLAAAGGSSGPAIDPKVSAFIANWQATHDPKEGIAPLAAALKAQGLGGDRFKYEGGVLSNNELDIGGKYKVLGGEGTAGAYWYKPGMNDLPGGGGGGSAPAVMPRQAVYVPGSLASLGPVTPAYVAPRVTPGTLRAIA